MLKAENLSIGYGNLPPVIKDVQLELKKGEMMVMIGPNGSGKSTILRALARVIRPQQGTVYLDAKPIRQISVKALAREMAFLPQSPLVPEDFTIRDLVSLGRNPHMQWNSRMRKEDWAVVDEAIEWTRLSDMQDRTMATLSGGEKQRAFIALALAQKPNILLLDEPTTFLDICYQFEVLELVKSLNEKLGISTIMVLHDLNQASRYAQTITAVYQGRIIASGKPEEVMTKELLAEIFKIRVTLVWDNINRCPFFIPMESLHH